MLEIETTATAAQIVVCNGCRAEYPLTVTERPLSDTGDIDVGVECPHCHYWTHSYYLNRRLKSLQQTLKRLRAKAGKSEKHWQRFKQKQAHYQRLFDDLNQGSLEGEQPRVVARLKQAGLPAGLSITDFINQAHQILGANGGNHGPSS